MATETRTRHTAGAFDIRLIISLLFAIYGLVLAIMGIAVTSATEIEKSAGININLWGGIAMLVFAAAFAAWAKLRPIIIDESAEGVPDES